MKAPAPIFFTHSTNKAAYESILQTGWILPGADDYVPVSLDGGISKPWGKYVFMFPLEALQGKRVNPVFYLGTNDMIETVEGPNFLIMDMVCIFATEVMIFEALDVRQARVSTIAPPPTPLTLFLGPAFPELQEHGRAVMRGKDIRGYSPLTLTIVEAYNQMLAEFSSIDYQAVKNLAKKEAPGTEWEIWWE